MGVLSLKLVMLKTQGMAITMVMIVTSPLSCHQGCQGKEGVGRTQEGPRSQDRQAGDPGTR